jgi:hypothetical protein
MMTLSTVQLNNCSKIILIANLYTLLHAMKLNKHLHNANDIIYCFNMEPTMVFHPL